ncbi:hypothetical protein EJ08DRAFT_648911 [Tothia fuscella]|uniref:Uncharacterized protein n=1 Tax=Tothia fuscella TaxID=1048955 RepID=A0A9P4NUD7_9PEZI|nr:hypothetical protein EJ08DRAFT_648911 [Tothia fuscella]
MSKIHHPDSDSDANTNTTSVSSSTLLPPVHYVLDHNLFRVNHQVAAESTEAFFKANTFSIFSYAALTYMEKLIPTTNAGDWVQTLEFRNFDWFKGEVNDVNSDIQFMGFYSELKKVVITFNVKKLVWFHPYNEWYEPRSLKALVKYFHLNGLFDLPRKTKLKEVEFDCMEWGFYYPMMAGNQWQTMKDLVEWLKMGFQG